MGKKDLDKKELEMEIDEFMKGQIEHQEVKSVKEYLSTGSLLLDLAISNRKNGGIPVGRITEIFGWEGTGKSLLTYHIARSCQEKGGLVVYIDTERAADRDFMKRMGVNLEKNFIYPPPPPSIEDVFALIEKVVIAARKKWPGREKPVLVIWDSLAVSPAKESLEENYGEGRLGSEARAMSSSLTRAMEMLDLGYVTLVVVNQKRTKIGSNKYDTETTTKGKSLAFYCSTRIDVKQAGKMLEGNKRFGRIIGINIRAVVNKSKMGPSFRTVEFPIMFDWGVDDEASWLDYLKEIGVVKVSGSWSKLYIDGEEHRFQGVDKFKEKLALPGVYNKIKTIIEDSMIVTFSEKKSFVEDAIVNGDD